MDALIRDSPLSSDSEDDCDYVPEEEESEKDDSSNDEFEPDEKLQLRSGKDDQYSASCSKSFIDSKPSVSSEEEKKKANELWQGFLNDVGGLPVKKQKTDSPDVKVSTSVSNDSSSELNTKVVTDTIEKPSTSKSVDNDSEEVSSETAPCKAVIDSNDIKTEVKSPQIPVNRTRSNLQSTLQDVLNKKKKVNTLEKSLLDWKEFKKSEGIEEDLEKVNKGKQGYLERQAFLQRCDYRSFEKERDIRLGKRKNSLL